MDIPGRNCTSSSCATTSGDRLLADLTNSLILLHKASIIPAIAKTRVQISNNALATIKQLLRGLCRHTQTTCALVKPASVSDCRSVPAQRTVGLSSVKHVNNYWKKCHNIWETRGPRRTKPIFLLMSRLVWEEFVLRWWQLLNCICCDSVSPICPSRSVSDAATFCVYLVSI